MASRSLSSLLFVALLISALAAGSHGGRIAIYWGQNMGTLADTCNTGRFSFVILAFLPTFGNGQTPVIDACDPTIQGSCNLSSDIRTCQSRGVKVFLSLGGGGGSYGLNSSADALSVATYLWDNYLGGNSSSRPLGDAVLDGIDFDIELGSAGPYDELARHLSDFGRRAGSKVYLSAAPECRYPDYYVGKALQTGLFDYVWVQFYNSVGCDYTSGIGTIRSGWETWTSSLPSSSTVFMGLPAGKGAANSGYIPPDQLISLVLPVIKGASNYGGIMLWNRLFDLNDGYSAAVNKSV